jgi:hypothetical protein
VQHEKQQGSEMKQVDCRAIAVAAN